jgi:hypothetical protein
VLLLTVFASIWGLGQASAAITAPINDPNAGFTLQQVIEAEGIRVGDKVFDLFTVNNSLSTGGAQVPDASGITVYGVYVNGELGLRFTGGWAATGEQVADTVVIFRVTADRPWLISDNSLWMDGYGARDGGLVAISENVFAENPSEGYSFSLADKYVYYASASEMDVLDHQEFTNPEGELVAVPEIWVVKDIIVNGGPNSAGSAGLSQFYQTFSQIPEPVSTALLTIGGLLMVARRNRHS